MASLEERLCAGLEAQDWRETATRGPWRRFAKFGRGAMYVWPLPSHSDDKDVLWFSELHQSEPCDPVVGPILQQVLAAGDKALQNKGIDTTALLVGLMDEPGSAQLVQKHGRDNQNGQGEEHTSLTGNDAASSMKPERD